jgi:putative endonuclease
VSERRAVGRRGEELAADYLRRHGFEIVATNWRTRVGEIDIVARERGTLVFVEVRSRTAPSRGTAEESVDGKKQRRLVRTAEQFLQEHAPHATARIDVVTVVFQPGREPELRHIVGAVST